MYFIYIIRSVSKEKFYTGITNNIDRRLKEHNQKLSNTVTTKNLTDFELIFLTAVDNRQLARIVEKYLKSGSGREFRKNLLQ